jgi:type IV secretory pathway protease TraF
MDNPVMIALGVIAVLIAFATVVFVKARNRSSGSVNVGYYYLRDNSTTETKAEESL